jgi:hypothetical protein
MVIWPKNQGIVVCPHAEWQARGVHGDVSHVWQTFAAGFRWVMGVAGNHDLMGQLPVPGQANAHLLDGESVTVDGLRIAGISGMIGAAKDGRAWRRDLRSFATVLQAVLRGDPDMLLLHQGPDAGMTEQPGHGAIRMCSRSAAMSIGPRRWRCYPQVARCSTSMDMPCSCVPSDRAIFGRSPRGPLESLSVGSWSIPTRDSRRDT